MAPPQRDRSRHRRSRPTQQTLRRRRLTALLGVSLVVVAVAAAIAVAAGGGGQSATSPPAAAAPPTSSPSTSPTTTAPTTTATHSTSGSPATGAPYRVGITSMTLTEPAAAAIATGHSASGAPIRTLPTIVRYPARGNPDSGTHPGAIPAARGRPFGLIVFSQGYDVSAESYAWLLTAWARAGYVVADPTYPLTDPATPGGVNEEDIVNHPGDLRFAISALVAAAQDPQSMLHGLIDASRVGIVGHSDGGDVSFAVAANSCCQDAHVKAAVILSGAELAAFGGSYDHTGHVPLLVVQGSADTINIPGCSAQIYTEAGQPKYYLNIAGAEHQPPYLNPGPQRGGVARAVTAFFDAYLARRPAALHALVRHGTVAPTETITSGDLPPGTSTACPGAP